MQGRQHVNDQHADGESGGSVRPGRRVSTACARCRRQKLKCDSMKPCTLCVRSGMECRPRVLPVPPVEGRAQKPVRRPGRRQRQTESDADTEAEMRPGTGGPSTPAHPNPRMHYAEGIRNVADSVASEPSQSASLSTTAPMPRVPSAARQPSPDTQQFGANRPTISLAMNMYKSLGTSVPLVTSTIPGDAPLSSPTSPQWVLQSMQLPPLSTMEVLMDIYFEKVDWFIWLFHRPSFVQQARQVLSAASWRREDMRKILVTLVVASLGLKCAIQDPSPQGRHLLASISDEPRRLMEQMIGEVRLHLIDLLDDSCIETVQVCILLGAFYVFYGSPRLAWVTIGMSIRASYALALHCDSETSTEQVLLTQIRRRCWNHLTVADTFASQIYGRPGSLDPEFSHLLPLTELDDTTFDATTEESIQDTFGGCVTGLSFHWLKYKLYVIIRKILSTFRKMRLHNPMTVDELNTLVEAVQDLDSQLAVWRSSLPPALNSDNISADHFQQPPSQLSEQDHRQQERMKNLRRLKLQAYVLQITHDAAVILAHRPILEHKLSSESGQGASKSTTGHVSRSFDASVKAALRISRLPVIEFRTEFCLAFIFTHLFSAGVILCIPPTSQPYSSTAQEAKAGVFRIIQAAKALRPDCQIAGHTERLLSDLLKLSLHREVDMAFKEERQASAINQEMNQQHHQNYDGRPMLSSNFPTGQADASSVDVSYDETLGINVSNLHSVNRSSMPRDAGVTVGNIDAEWAMPAPPTFQALMSPDSCDMPRLDLPLDEAFGAFGQVMFNLVPDDPLNIWGWGKRSM